MKLGVTLDPRSGIQEQKLSEDQAHPHPSLEQHQRRQKVVPMIKTDTFDTKIHKKNPLRAPETPQEPFGFDNGLKDHCVSCGKVSAS
jgi:hypothetical protein